MKTFLFLILLALNLLDATITSALVELYGPEAEANPLLRYLINQVGIVGAMAVKIPFLAVLFAFRDRINIKIWLVLNIIYSSVVLYGTYLLFKDLML